MQKNLDKDQASLFLEARASSRLLDYCCDAETLNILDKAQDDHIHLKWI